MNPKAMMTLFLLATACGISLVIFEFFGESTSPTWMGYMWIIYTIAMAGMTYTSWKKIKPNE